MTATTPNPRHIAAQRMADILKIPFTQHSPAWTGALKLRGRMVVGEFTKGPWLVRSNGLFLRVVHGDHKSTVADNIISEANAHLIAAGPDTYDCTVLLDGLCAWLLHRFGPDSPEGQEAQFRLVKARAAIAKALGQEAGK